MTGRPYLLTHRDIAERTGHKLADIQNADRAGRMPRPLHIGQKNYSEYARGSPRWPLPDIQPWIDAGAPLHPEPNRIDRWIECWGPLLLTPRKTCASLRLGVRGKPRNPGTVARYWVEQGVIDEPFPSLSAQAPPKGGLGEPLREYYHRDKLERRHRGSVRLGKRTPAEWDEWVLLDQFGFDDPPLLGLKKHTLRELMRQGKFPASSSLDPTKAGVISAATRWRREGIARWLAEQERRFAHEQAERHGGVFLTTTQLAAVLQLSEDEIPLLGIPESPGGYRPDHVMNWLAWDRERQRERDEVLRPIAMVQSKEAGWLLSIYHTAASALDDDPDEELVALMGSIARWGSAEEPKRSDKWFRVSSVMRRIGLEPPTPADVEIGEPELMRVLDVSAGEFAKARRKGEQDRQEFFARGRPDPWKENPSGARYTIEYPVASGGTTWEVVRRHKSVARTKLRKRTEAEWKRAVAQGMGFPQATERDGARWYSLPEVAAWLDGLEERERKARGYGEEPGELAAQQPEQTGAVVAGATQSAPVCPCNKGVWVYDLTQQQVAFRLSISTTRLRQQDRELREGGARRDWKYARCTECEVEFYRTRFCLGCGKGVKRKDRKSTVGHSALA